MLVRYGIDSLLPARFVPARQPEPFDNPIVRREIARAQQMIEGQNVEIRRTLERYSAVVEPQRRRVMDHRQNLLHGRQTPTIWHRKPNRRAALVEAVGEASVRRGELAVTLLHTDRGGTDHLGRCADLREGIHLVRLGNQDPLTRFTAEAITAFDELEDGIDLAVLDALDAVRKRGDGLDLQAAGVSLKGPAATWTYLVNDDPFRDQIGQMLTGPVRTSVAILSAALLAPLVIAWALADRYLRKRPLRRSDPFR